ncbi:MAG: 3-ketoacyl-ACP reductase [Acetobacteraceae bacterium]
MPPEDFAANPASAAESAPRPARGAAIVTGGRRGIGAATAMALAANGFSVAIVDLEEDRSAAATLAAIRARGGRGLFIRSDISDLEGHDEIVARTTREYGPVTCLVNNAGLQVPVRGDLLDTTPEIFDRLLATNLRGTFFLTLAVARAMISRPAPASYRSIIIVSSANAALVSPEKAAYCISKSALPMLAKLFATRLAAHEIDVFEIQPGLIRTDMTEPVRAAYGQAIDAGLSPYRRWGEAAEVGAVISTLASGLLPFSTGTMVPVGGGLHIHRL